MTKRTYTEDDIRFIQSLMQPLVSLNKKLTPQDGAEEAEFGDFIVDTAPSPEEVYAVKHRKKAINGYLTEYLSPREEIIIRMRYGLNDGIPMTLEDIGKKFDLTRERIRQIESVALRKLKHKFEDNGIKGEDTI